MNDDYSKKEELCCTLLHNMETMKCGMYLWNVLSDIHPIIKKYENQIDVIHIFNEYFFKQPEAIYFASLHADIKEDFEKTIKKLIETNKFKQSINEVINSLIINDRRKQIYKQVTKLDFNSDLDHNQILKI